MTIDISKARDWWQQNEHRELTGMEALAAVLREKVELERQLADVLEGALQPETFDPQAVRELLGAHDAYIECSFGLDEDAKHATYARFRRAIDRVRESEKK